MSKLILENLIQPKLLSHDVLEVFCVIIAETIISRDGVCRLSDSQIAARTPARGRTEDAVRQKVNGCIKKLVGLGVISNVEPSRKSDHGRPSVKGLRPSTSWQKAMVIVTKGMCSGLTMGEGGKVTTDQNTETSGVNSVSTDTNDHGENPKTDHGILRSPDQIHSSYSNCVENEDCKENGKCIVGINAGDLGDNCTPYRIVRQVLTNVEQIHEMAELAASHFGRSITRRLKSGDILTEDDVDGDGHIHKHILPLCACGDAVAYGFQELHENVFKVFPRKVCENCKAAGTFREREAIEKDFDQRLSKGWVKFIHDGDVIPMNDYTSVGGELRLKYIRELALDRCECGLPVFYQLVKGDGVVCVNASEQCWTCGRLQAVLENPLATGSQADYAQ